MQNGQCPKCEARTVYRSVGAGLQSGLRAGDGSPFLNVYKENRWVPDVDLLALQGYVCRSCGYVELYVEDVPKLAKLDASTNWHAVS